MKTYMAKPGDVTQQWRLVDAEGKVLGRLAAACARILMGKHRPEYTPHVDTGDYIVVVNADKMRLTGKKMDQKMYKRYSGHPGGLRETPAKEMLAQKPAAALRLAVRRMLPKSKLGKHMLTKLKVFAGGEHSHEAQQPQPLDLKLT